jgi:hypothetical protein
MTEPFRWKNCHADVLSSGYGEMARSYVRDIVEPSLAAMEHRIEKLNSLSQKGDMAADFSVGPAQELLRATMIGYCLSLQALWEKQIRGYLESCARELKSDHKAAQKSRTGTWEELHSLFEQIRGVPLSAFDEFAKLNVLQLLGNVCRHGRGGSLQRLAVEHPELWPAGESLQLIPPPPGMPSEPTRTEENLVISLDLLRSLAAAIDTFWRETEYIYNESIHRKHPSLEALLVTERKERAGRGRPWDPVT